MRRCALWVTPWAAEDREYILDTDALDGIWPAEWREPRPMPAGMLLVLVHPARAMTLRREALPWYGNGLDWGAAIAARVIDRHCFNDPELARVLRWER